MKIGIVGFGFVGRAVYEGFKDTIGEENILINDIIDKHDALTKYNILIDDIGELVRNCVYIFICVPTPTNIHTGSIDISIVEKVIGEIASRLEKDRGDPLLIVKSTVTPGTCRKIYNKYHKLLPIVFNPEFLTEKNYIDDFKSQDHIVLGGDYDNCRQVLKMYKGYGFPEMDGVLVSWEEAEMAKYIRNCFLASKVALFNEFYRICKAAGINYKMIAGLAAIDPRIGESHINVPGHDGDFGFGGKCFPKDLLALIDFAKGRQVDAKILKQVWESNLEVRADRNWLNIPGAIE